MNHKLTESEAKGLAPGQVALFNELLAERVAARRAAIRNVTNAIGGVVLYLACIASVLVFCYWMLLMVKDSEQAYYDQRKAQYDAAYREDARRFDWKITSGGRTYTSDGAPWVGTGRVIFTDKNTNLQVDLLGEITIERIPNNP